MFHACYSVELQQRGQVSSALSLVIASVAETTGTPCFVLSLVEVQSGVNPSSRSQLCASKKRGGLSLEGTPLLNYPPKYCTENFSSGFDVKKASKRSV